MTSGQQPLSAGRPAPPDSPPPDVLNATTPRGFGALISSRALPNPVTTAAAWLGAGAVSLVLMYVIANVGSGVDRYSIASSLVHAVVFFFFLFGLYGIVFAVKRLIVGARSYWVFENGFAYRQRSGVRALGWGEVARLAPVIGKKGDTAGKVLHYDLVPTAGKPVPVPLVVENGRDPFMDALMAALQRHGKPIS